MVKSLKKGKVRWDTSQGETHGTVIAKVTGTAKTGSHTAKASMDEPQYRVRSAKTGKEAIHHAAELKRG
jgi:Hypervirulence associated proteins TUDOR domain